MALLPNDPHIEALVLGQLIAEPNFQDFIAHITPEFFYNEDRKSIFAECKIMYEAQIPISLASICQRIGRYAEVAELTMHNIHSVTFEWYCRLLEQMMRQRMYILHCMKVVQDTEYWSKDFGDMVDDNTAVMAEIMDLKNWKAQDMSAATDDALESLKIKGIDNPSGWFTLDKFIGGFKRQDLILIAGRPGMGKTALGLCLACAHEIQGGKPAFISLEMPKDAIAKRRLSMISGFEASRIINKDLSDKEIERAGIMHINNPTGMLIDDTPGMDIYAIGSKIKQMVRHDKITAVFVDYIQLIKPSVSGKQINKEQEIGRISTGLKLLARQLNIPIIAMAQVNRNNEARNDKRPQLSDLRDSGQLEQDADVVMFPFRPKYYEKSELDNQVFEEVENCELIIAKNRNGKTGTIGKPDKDYLTFDPLTIQYIFR